MKSPRPMTILVYVSVVPLGAYRCVRLEFAPGRYGVANVKWLERIEVIDTRFMGHFMARDYVTRGAARRAASLD
jgi:DMSO/TMAO reductase YedYZ molybdopterin-dependent catalytic subunit